jgi:tRNA(Ile)-lysidine synthase
LTVEAAGAGAEGVSEHVVEIPGEIAVPAFGLRLRIEVSGAAPGQRARLRNWRAGDRVRLRHSSGPRKVKEVLERMRITGSSRAIWPVLEVDGRIVWMKGVELEPEGGIHVGATSLEGGDDGCGEESTLNETSGKRLRPAGQ